VVVLAVHVVGTARRSSRIGSRVTGRNQPRGTTAPGSREQYAGLAAQVPSGVEADESVEAAGVDENAVSFRQQSP
jgi:hypothetical protein